MRATVVLATAIVALSPALASDLPMPDLPDPTRYCQSLDDELAINQCLRVNQGGYDSAKRLWPRLSDYSAQLCTRVADSARKSPMGYAAFGDCVRRMHLEYDAP
jgi:hypothetical protein